MVQICTRCIMDSSIPGIRFDEKGICNFCKIHDDWEKQFPLNEETDKKLKELIERIKDDGKNKKYDCIVGVSGGIDSTYTLYLIKKFGLRPLAVHLDNGWNSELSVNNIKNALTKLNVDLVTHVLDWEEFKDLQISFLKASVSDVEIPTDLAIISVLYGTAFREGLHYIITGGSFRTEGKIPIAWTYLMDGKYIRSVQKIFGTKKLKTFPNFTISKRLFYNYIRKIKMIYLMNYMDYNREEAKRILEKELGWRPYQEKHYESIYTRFIQSYLLPKKFNIDKRIVHYSALMRSGQMKREEALKKIQNESPYPEEKIKEDKSYVIKKLGLTEEEFDEIIARPPKLFLDYPTQYPLFKTLREPLKLAYKFMSFSKGAPPTIFKEMEQFEEDIYCNSLKKV